ncbi:MAG TPA: hypothetical protein VKB88_05020 [Bryobacteraceae bacterium]|nr:hypothetical protein [Bryobacteraceae bacterium]
MGALSLSRFLEFCCLFQRGYKDFHILNLNRLLRVIEYAVGGTYSD